MSVWTKIIGIMGNRFQIGGPSGVNLNNNAVILEVKNAANTAFAKIKGASISAGDVANNIVSLLDLQGRIALIQYDFDGASPPAPGDNTNKFGFCHTTGGSYTAGDILYDPGSVALVVMPFEVCRHITTTSAVTGTISFIANGLYAQESLRTFVLKGDGGSTSTGQMRSISVAYAHDAIAPVSTTSIPANAKIYNVRNDVTEVFNGTAPTVAVTIEGAGSTTVQAAADNAPKTIGVYDTPQYTDNPDLGVVKVTVVPDSSTTGAGTAMVEYTTPSA